jgi:hypothetical protein
VFGPDELERLCDVEADEDDEDFLDPPWVGRPSRSVNQFPKPGDEVRTLPKLHWRLAYSSSSRRISSTSASAMPDRSTDLLSKLFAEGCEVLEQLWALRHPARDFLFGFEFFLDAAAQVGEVRESLPPVTLNLFALIFRRHATLRVVCSSADWWLEDAAKSNEMKDGPCAPLGLRGLELVEILVEVGTAADKPVAGVFAHVARQVVNTVE